ncbi:hypothetical protein GS501_00170 [Saccharibacter sp. 17.LH.SD]|uniref:hypothetical protein n=1 Tax=Saccharibacter sp. 17.LH.SD TaxID=2689393 RepID=UPI00136D9F6A|nr:hypothetical protein [Saccharibacter sp. 17.LH.SD]MXV43496.1 hypothetical protein [Saccharibacter sp. 17.LH.SD]
MSEDKYVVKRERYLKILNVLNERQGKRVYGPEITELYDIDVLCTNLEYLHDIGLVYANILQSADGYWSFADARITPKGIAYFEEAGGLYKKETSVRIEIESSALKEMLEAYVQATTKDKTAKSKMMNAIKSAPAEALKTLVGRMFQEGLQEVPHVWQLIESVLSH